MSDTYILELQGIEKSFPGVKALNNVHLQLREGSVHALLGENGAGKSTLMKILSGIYSLEKGTILLHGKPVVFSNTRESQQSGIAIIHQELNLCWNLTVAENVLLGHEDVGKFNFYKKKENIERVAHILKNLGVDHIDPKAKVSDLSIAHQQMVEIAKAISIDAKILIMDEPTSSLTEKEEVILFQMIKKLQSQGVSIIYISHKLDEIFQICDEVTILRDGEWIITLPIAEVDKKCIVEHMVGRPLNMFYPEQKSQCQGNSVRLQVKDYHKEGVIDHINFDIRSGEILGVSGLVGAGRSEMAKTIFGVWPKDSGTLYIDGKEVTIHTPKDAIDAGIAFVSEDRKQEGLTLGLSVKDNMMSINLDMVKKWLGFVDTAKEQSLAEQGVANVDIKTPSIHTKVRALSGGNQQKVIIARWLMRHMKVLILDEPTRGIDVGAKKAIYDIMRSLTEQGIAIVMISSELPEILGMSDRIAVMKEGRILSLLHRSEASQERIMTIITEG